MSKMQPNSLSKETIQTQGHSPKKNNRHYILSPEEFHLKSGLDFCFLMDITGSMQNYVDGTRKSLKQLILQLQGIFSDLVKIGFLGYRDFEKENPGQQQFEYINLEYNDYLTIEESALYKMINNIKCSGGGDTAEDIRGAIKKANEVMTWGGRQKYLILIADAPAHGKKYSEGVDDNYPGEELEDALLLLIKKEIRLVILQVTENTNKMVTEIKEFYKKNQMEEFVETNKLNANTVEELTKTLTSCLCQTIQNNLGKQTIKW